VRNIYKKNIKPVSLFLVPAGNGSGCLTNTSPNLTTLAKSISVYLSAPTFHAYGNTKQTSVTFGMGNRHRKELYEYNVQLVLVVSAIGLQEAGIKIPKFVTNEE